MLEMEVDAAFSDHADRMLEVLVEEAPSAAAGVN